VPYDPRRAAHANGWQPCSVRGCPKRRAGLALTCAVHTRHLSRFGDPLQNRIHEPTLRPYLKLAQAFLQKYAAHPSTEAALHVMAELLAPGLEEPISKPLGAMKYSPRYLVHRELRRLAVAEPSLSAHEALKIVLGVWLLAAYEPRRFKNDGKPLTYAISHFVFRARPLRGHYKWYDDEQRSDKRTQCPGALALNLFGTRVRSQLGGYLTRVLQAIEQERQERIARTALLSQPIIGASALTTSPPPQDTLRDP
jgi:hypothetical protein